MCEPSNLTVCVRKEICLLRILSKQKITKIVIYNTGVKRTWWDLKSSNCCHRLPFAYKELFLLVLLSKFPVFRSPRLGSMVAIKKKLTKEIFNLRQSTGNANIFYCLIKSCDSCFSLSGEGEVRLIPRFTVLIAGVRPIYRLLCP